jgi:hypothetical protein
MNSPTIKGMSLIHTQKMQAKNEKIMSESFKGPSFFKPPSSKMSSHVVSLNDGLSLRSNIRNTCKFGDDMQN